MINQRIPFVDLTRQYKAIEKEVDESVHRVLSSGHFILDNEATEFESEFAHYLGIRNVRGVNSGTDALRLAVQALNLKPEDEIITVANTYVSTVDAILYSRATPKLCDIDIDTYSMNLHDLERRVTSKTKALIAVHMHGLPCHMEQIMNLVEKYQLKLIEDVAQAAGSSYKGKKLGTFGDAACFSFYPTKNLAAYGDAGAIVTQDDEFAQRINMLRNYGQRAKYIHEIVGYNSRLDEIQAAILRVKLKHLDKWNGMRRKNAELYEKFLAEIDQVIIPDLANDIARYHVFHLFIIRCEQRDALKAYLERNQIFTQIHYPIPIHKLHAYANLGYTSGDFPFTELAAETSLSLPMFPELTENEISRISSVISKFFKKQK